MKPSNRDFKMSGKLTLTFEHWPTALIAHQLLKAALSAIGNVHSMNLSPPSYNPTPTGDPPSPQGPFTIVISGES